MTTTHHVKEQWYQYPVRRISKDGKTVMPPGYHLAVCSCGWEQGIRYSNEQELTEKSLELNRLIGEHTAYPNPVPNFFSDEAEAWANALKPNSGHPFFQEIQPIPVKYRKKPVEVEARQWNPNGDPNKVIGWMLDNNCVPGGVDLGQLLIPTLEGVMRANPGDWIIKGVKNEFYPCKPDVFAETYEEAEKPRRWKYPVC